MLRIQHVVGRKAQLRQQSRSMPPSKIVVVTSLPSSLSCWNLRQELSTTRFLTTAMPKEEEGTAPSSDEPVSEWRKISSQNPAQNTSSILSNRSSASGGSVMEFFNRRRENSAATTSTISSLQVGAAPHENAKVGSNSLPRPTMGNFSAPTQNQSFGGPQTFQGNTNAFGRQQPSWNQLSPPSGPVSNGNNQNRQNNMPRAPQGPGWGTNAPPSFNSNSVQQQNGQEQQQPSNPFFRNPANQSNNSNYFQRGNSPWSGMNNNSSNNNVAAFAPPSRQQQQPHQQPPPFQQHQRQNPPTNHSGRSTDEFLTLLKKTPPTTEPSIPLPNTNSFRAAMGQQQQQQPQQPGGSSHSFSFGRSTQPKTRPFDMSGASQKAQHANPNSRTNPLAPPFAPWSDAKMGNILSSLPNATPLPNLTDMQRNRSQNQTVGEASARVAPPQYDVSDLRAALLNALEQNKRRKRELEQKSAAHQASMQSQDGIPVDKMGARPAWRNDREYSRNLSMQHRKRREQQEMTREEARDNNRRLESNQLQQQQSIPMTYKQRRQLQQKSRLRRGSVVHLPDRSLDVTELSRFYQVKVVRLTTILKSLGENPEGSSSFRVDLDMMELVAMELGYQPVRPTRRKLRTTESDDRETLLQRRAFSEVAETSELYQSFPSRPPVVCIMGHVDHGKTTLMDSLRRRSRQAQIEAAKASAATTSNGKSKKDSTTKGDVAGSEAGGITQAISAFQIKLASDPSTAVTFLDTPGHAAFRAMRESGSQAADVLVLVIAADDGVSPQTVEIINFYKSLVKEVGPSGISLVIALNKIDKDGIDVEESKARIMNQLLEHDIVTEDVGYAGDTEYGPPVQLVPVSGLTGQGLDELIESLALQSEIMDLRADVEARAEGLVMEASVDQGLGVTAHCVVRWGSLQRGDVVISGTCWGRVKVLKDVHDATLDKALPSQPVQIVGFSSLPKAGDPFMCVASEEIAKQLIERRKTMKIANAQAAASPDVKYVNPNPDEELETGRRRQKKGPQPSQIDFPEDDGCIRIPIMVKADTDATLAALRESLQGLVEESAHEIVLDWVTAGVGPITTAEVRVAKQAGASIFTFGLGKRKNDIKKIMDSEKVEARDHTIIYALLDDAKKVFAKYLPPAVEDVVHGKARVQAIFDIKGSHVAGLKIMDGKLFKEKAALQGSSMPCHYRVLRGGERVNPEETHLKAASLKVVKDDVVEVKKGDECGLILEDFDDIRVDDVIECYSTRVSHAFA